MLEGRERDVMSLLIRATVALEKLAEEPIVEMEVGPPVCPHCNYLNPMVTHEPSDGATGRLHEFFVPFSCGKCDQEFFAVPMQWSMHTDLTTLQLEIEGRERAEAQNGRANKRENQAT
jgi:hypothetical protein